MVLKLSEPVSLLRLAGGFAPIKAEPVTNAGRRHHGGRRQFCRRLRGRSPCRAWIPLRPPARDIVWPASWYAIPVRSSRAEAMPPRQNPTHRRSHARRHDDCAATRHQKLAASCSSRPAVIPVLHHRAAGGRGTARQGACRRWRADAGSHAANAGRRSRPPRRSLPTFRRRIVGIGTILNADDLARREALGAKFGISPGATPDLLKAATASALPLAPGIATASS